MINRSFGKKIEKIITIDGAFVVGFNEDKYTVYNTDEEKFYNWVIEDQTLLVED